MKQDHAVIKNDAIALRQTCEHDREQFFYLQQDAHVNRYIKAPPSDEYVENFFQLTQKPWIEEDRTYHGFAISELSDGKMIGLAFYRYRDKGSAIIEIGWKMHPEKEGMGIATQAARLLMEYLLANYSVHKFVAHCDVDNVASERIMQKLGMQKEAHFISNYKIGNKWSDEFAYGLVCK